MSKSTFASRLKREPKNKNGNYHMGHPDIHREDWGATTPEYTNSIYKKNDEVVNNDPMQSMIKEYKEHISKTHLEDERYKWELVNEFRGRPNLKAEDLYQEIKDTNFGN